MRKLTFFSRLHYDGSAFVGWQRQPEGRTVQGEVERVLKELTRHDIPIVAAGRTDSGVHSRGQTVSFEVPEKWTAEDLHRAMNALMPQDIWVATVGDAPKGFNARRQATSRRYRYIVGCDAESRSPFRLKYEWALGHWPDLELLNQGADLFLGEHDFTGFSAVGQEKPHYRCEIGLCEWVRREGDQGIIFNVVANRFLHHMVRFMVGTMIDVGMKKRPLEDISRLLTASDNSQTSPPAPAQGLYLMHVEYPQLKEDL
jgi:tRNA pseudouridine38-40 synthase